MAWPPSLVISPSTSSVASSMTFSWTGMMTATSSATRTLFCQVALEVGLVPAPSWEDSVTQSACGMVARTGRRSVLVPMDTVGNAWSATEESTAAPRKSVE